MNIRKLWFGEPGVYPLFATISLAAVVCCGFMTHYFTGHTEVSWDKQTRTTHDNQGLSEHRVHAHNWRPFMWLNKHAVKVFPFNYRPMAELTEKFRFDRDP